MQEVIWTGAAASLLALTFLLGERARPLRLFFRDPRSLISFGAGMSAAYVFVHLMPELHQARESFVESASIVMRYQGMGIYLVALVGFLLFYALSEAINQLKAHSHGGEIGPAFRLHLGGLAAYVGLMAYLLVHKLGEEPTSILLYALAIACHFRAMDYSLREEYGAAYERFGRPLLAGMCLLGWGLGQLIALPLYVLSLLVAFISGAIIMNNSIMELPAGKDGRVIPFVLGGILYGLILIPLG